MELEEKPGILLSLGAEPSTPYSNPRTEVITLVFPTMLFGLGEPSLDCLLLPVLLPPTVRYLFIPTLLSPSYYKEGPILFSHYLVHPPLTDSLCPWKT